MRLITICVLFCSCLFVAQHAVADASRVPEIAAHVSASLENLEGMGISAGPGNNIHMHLTARSAHKSRNGKSYVYKFNRYGQLISVKRIGGVERQFAYSNPSAHIPQLVKIGKRPWAQLPQKPYTKSGPQATDAGDATSVGPQLEMGSTIDLNVALPLAQYDVIRKDEIDPHDDDEYEYDDDDFDWVEDLFDIVDSAPDDSGGGTSSGYCQTRHCSFPSLAACMADCERTNQWGQVACGTFGVIMPNRYGAAAVVACQGVLLSAYYNICKPGCEAGNR
jgi:hypothetical protein